jgi:hypothetical protein
VSLSRWLVETKGFFLPQVHSPLRIKTYCAGKVVHVKYDQPVIMIMGGSMSL